MTCASGYVLACRVADAPRGALRRQAALLPQAFVPPALSVNARVSAVAAAPGAATAVGAATATPRPTLSCIDGLPAGVSTASVSDVQPFAACCSGSATVFHCGDGTSVACHAVNDDFCDCSTGLDEPRTAACATSSFFCDAGVAEFPVHYSPTLPARYVPRVVSDCLSLSAFMVL